MNTTEMKKYAALMQEMDLTGLEIDEQRGVYRLEREGKRGRKKEAESESAESNETAERENSSVEDSTGGKILASPMVGVFYAAPTETADPFVQLGDHVKKGDVLCIIEAMKLMNEVTAETDGEIVELCAANGQFVEYGSPLFRIREGKER